MWASCTSLAFAAAFFAAGAAGAQERVYLGREEALERALRGAAVVRTQTLTLSGAQAGHLSADTGVDMVDSAYVFYHAGAGAERTRSAVIMDVRGQYQPITFYVAIGAAGNVERVEVMAYRESRGAEVRRRAFLEQFQEKSLEDRLSVGAGIRHVSGATISSRSIARGVRLALKLYAMLPGETEQGQDGF